jgi:superfamily II DNA/RNA helicase
LLDSEKYPSLVKQLGTRKGSVIVFTKTKFKADAIAKKLSKDGYKANALHGDLRQNKRNTVIADFRKQSYNILVATDIAARGLRYTSY